MTGLAAWAIAAAGQSIYELVEWTSAFGTSGVLVAFLFGAYAMFGGGKAAVAAIAAGFGCNFLAVILPSFTGGEEMEGAFLLSIAVSLVAYVAVAAVERVRRPAPAALP
jgi:peptidoglycan/LPS O-acetylase OafA/YrhL